MHVGRDHAALGRRTATRTRDAIQVVLAKLRDGHAERLCDTRMLAERCCANCTHVEELNFGGGIRRRQTKRRTRDVERELLEDLVASDKVSLRVDLGRSRAVDFESETTASAPSLAPRPAFFCAATRPAFRRIVTASSTSLFAFSNASTHFFIGAEVRARSSLMSAVRDGAAAAVESRRACGNKMDGLRVPMTLMAGRHSVAAVVMRRTNIVHSLCGPGQPRGRARAGYWCVL